jgi:hypothetical protein
MGVERRTASFINSNTTYWGLLCVLVAGPSDAELC